MVTALIDSSILIDVLRGYEPAMVWLSRQPRLGVTHIVWLELLEGAPNKSKQRQALQLLRRFEVVPLTETDMQWAINHLIQYGLSHNIDAFDCLIGSVNARLQIPLYTRNLKHFKPILGDLALAPF